MNTNAYINNLYGLSHVFKETNYIPSNTLPSLFVSDGTIPSTTAGDLYYTPAGGVPMNLSKNNNFAPKYLVGNIPNGDSAIAVTNAGFYYIPDIGDGSGIKAALDLAAVSAGVVWLRPGTYDLGAGTVPVPLIVPVGTSVSSGGNVSIISRGGADDQSVFEIQPDPTPSQNQVYGLENLSIITSSVPSTGGSGNCLIRMRGNNQMISNIFCDLKTTPAGNLRHAILLEPDIGSNLFPPAFFKMISVKCDSPTTYGSPAGPTMPIYTNNIFVSYNYVSVYGGDDAITLDTGSIWDGNQIVTQGWRDHGVHTLGDNGNNPSALRARTMTCLFDGNLSNIAHPIPIWLEAGFTNIAEEIACVDLGGARKSYGIQVTNYSALYLMQAIMLGHAVAVKLGDGPTPGAANCIIQGLFMDSCTRAFDFYQSQLVYVSYNSISVADNGSDYGNFITIDSCNNVTISDNKGTLNTIADPGTPPFISITNSDLITIDDNTLQTNGVNGIYNTSNNLYCTGNLISMTQNGVVYAIQSSGNYSIVENNNITGSTDGTSLIAISGSSQINNNILTNQDASALAVAKCIVSTSDNSVITGNMCYVTPDSSVNASPAITVDNNYNVCSNNNITLNNTHGVSAIVVNGNNSNIIGNICRTTIPVTDNGAGNQLGFNQ